MKTLIQNTLSKLGYQLTKMRSAEDDTEHYISLYGKSSVNRRAFYNIACGGHFGFGGNFQHQLWTNLDVVKDYKEWSGYNSDIDIAYDALNLELLPLEDNSAELFHSRFAIEHITDEAAEKMFKEIFRTLKKGGVARFIVPNLELDYLAYQKKDGHYFSWIENFSKPDMMELMKYNIPLNKASLEQVFLVHFAANASTIHDDGAEVRITDEDLIEIMQSLSFSDAMNKCTSFCDIEKQKIYRQNHINWWSYSKLENFLRAAGFPMVLPLSPGQSLSPVMRNRNYFDWLWNDVAIFMEAVKD